MDNHKSKRTMAYCHDSVGLGHFHRTLAISERICGTDPASTFLLATGTPYVPIFNLPEGVDYVKLPALAKTSGATYRGKYLNVSIERILRCRESILLSTARAFEPEVVLVDKAPAGVCGELLPTLRWLRKNLPRTRIVFGMRDIEDDPETTIAQWSANGAISALDQYYDEIWVYGMRTVFDVRDAYRLPGSIRDKMRFVGYVVQDPCRHDKLTSRDHNRVLVTVGGGTDGEFVLKTFLVEAAGRLSKNGTHTTIVGGPDLPALAAGALKRDAMRIPTVEWLDFVSCLPCHIRQADAIVSMGGYNTLCEVVSNRVPAVVIPRTAPRMEQAIRARLWSRRADLDVICPEQLTPTILADHLLAKLDQGPGNTEPNLDFNGLDRVSERFRSFWNGEAKRETAVSV